jgi:hypothetical protein
MPFTDDSEVQVRAVKEKDWKLLRHLEYKGNTDHFDVPVDTDTDFASVPRPFIWFLPAYGKYTKAAILHDYLWRCEVPAGTITRADADALFQRAMRELDVPFLRRWILWAAVRLGALSKPDGRKMWLRDSWKVFLLAVLALPVVALPAVLILIELAIFYILELLFYFPLAVLGKVRAGAAPADSPMKQVNAPYLGVRER